MLGGEIPRLRFAALRMTCGGEEVGWVPASARTTGGSGTGCSRTAPTRWLSDGWEGWVPAPRLHGGRISTPGQRGERDGRFANSPYQMVVRRVGGMGSRPPSSRGQDLDARTTGGAGRAVREQPLPDGCQTGGRDGSPPPVFTGAGSRRQDNGGVGLGLEVGDDGFEGLYGLVYVSVGVGEGGVELLEALEDSLLLDEVAEAGLDCVVGGQGGAVVGEGLVGEDDVEDGVFTSGLSGDLGLGAEVVQRVAESSSGDPDAFVSALFTELGQGWLSRRRRRRGYRSVFRSVQRGRRHRPGTSRRAP